MKIPRGVACALLTGIVLVSGGAQSVAEGGQRSVLFLIGLRSESPAGNVFGPVLQRDLSEALHGEIDGYVEYMDPARFPEPGYLDALRTFFRAKYSGRRFDLILAADRVAHDFLERYRDEVFPGTPVVFFSTDVSDAAFPASTGIRAGPNFRASLESALALQPETSRVFVVGGASAFDKVYESAARQQFAPLEQRVSFTYLVGLPMPELLGRLAVPPPRSIVFLLAFLEDGTGQRFTTIDMIDRITAAARMPVYGWVTVGLNHGIVGGRILSVEVVAQHMVSLALRVLGGENPDRIPVVQPDAMVTQYDWRQLRRWGIAESRLPPGSTILFREPGVWEQYRIFIVGGAAVLTLQTALIAALLLQRRRRRRVDQTLVETAQRYALATAAGAVGLWEWKADTHELYLDSQLKRMLGYEDAEIPNRLDVVLPRVHPDDQEIVRARWAACIKGQADTFRLEYRMIHKDGSARWVFAQGSVIKDMSGRVVRLLGTTTDITERKRTEEAIRESEAILQASHGEIQALAGRLIAAQETERTRIARDLHDDVSQDLAGLSIALSSVRRRIPAAADGEEIRAELAALQQRTMVVADNVRHLSHDLHPGILQHAGVIAALKACCDDLQRLHRLNVTLRTMGEFEAIDPDVALCLYRVAQEALRNVVVHARATHAEVQLFRTPEGAELTVVDDGRGFDIAKARGAGAGLGLISIGERVRLRGGILSVVTEVGKGTRIHVLVPMAAVSAGDEFMAAGV